ncbi:MAG: hypothetical protein ABR884_01100 [Minisyncoccia bacterium]|jgi:hypothetical protein
MTRLTAYEIAGNPDDIIATHAGPDNAGKYCGFITRGEVGRYRILISTPAIFDDPEFADDAMRKVVVDTTEWTENDLKDPENPLVHLLTSAEGSLVRQIVAAASN